MTHAAVAESVDNVYIDHVKRNDVAAPLLDLNDIDCEAFYAALGELRRRAQEDLGQRDLAHLRKVALWGRASTTFGLLTAALAPNPASAAALSFGRSTRWVLMHHIGHRGYDRVPGAPSHIHSKRFARGRRRLLDWADWLTPEAWVFEHNVLHHSHTAQAADPDLIEQSTEVLREPPFGPISRALSLGILSLSWRPGFYAPMAMWAHAQRRNRDAPPVGKYDFASILRAFFHDEYWKKGVAPYATLQFVALPLLFTPLGPWAVFSVLCNSLGAEVLTNVHAFLVVLPNHCGDDLYRHEAPPRTKAEACVRQIISSANYGTGGDLTASLQLWLNYQIEHHIWPDLPMLRYRELQPEVKKLCEAFGIPYVQEAMPARLRRMVSVVVGKSRMRRMDREGRAHA